MKWLTLKIEFLTGRYVAASVGDREKAEWPPHPGRVYMALAATCFERDENEDEVQALQWLESLKEPQIIDVPGKSDRSEVKFYVATNDKLTASKSILQATPGLMRSKQERMYPTIIPYESCCFYRWKVDEQAEHYLAVLNAIAHEVIRVGHSSSLVHASFSLSETTDRAFATLPRMERWLPVRRGGSLKVRTAGEGEFSRLKAACRMDIIDQFAELKQIIDSTKGKDQKAAKQKFEELFGVPYKNGIRPPEPTPATISLWQGYEKMVESAKDGTVVAGTMFDSELLVLMADRNTDQPNYTLSDTLALTRRLRDAVMAGCPKTPPPAWISGHDEKTGEPTKSPHIAFFPLSFVGHKYADGSVKGLAIAFPKSNVVSLHDRGAMLGPLLFDNNGEPRKIELKLGTSGSWTGYVAEGGTLPQSLQQETWIRPSRQWASVTPVVLDRFPKNSRTENRKAWEQEVREIVLQSCVRAGYPTPVSIDLDTTSWLTGTPRAYTKSRPLRGTDSQDERTDLGDGFPRFPTRNGKPPRLQIHVHLTFDCLVEGPVLMGAGRFLGYGFFRPISKE